MAFASPFVIYAVFSNAAQLERWLFYLDPDSRPDFVEEVPSHEAKLVEHFEFRPYPWNIERHGNSVTAYFGDPHEEEDLHEQVAPMAIGAKKLKAKLVLAYWSYEGEYAFEQYNVGRKSIILRVNEAGIKAASLLNDMQIAQICAMKDEPRNAFEYIANILNSTE